MYGRTKLAGELELAGDPDATIVRISWVCGDHGANMVKTILRLAARARDPAASSTTSAATRRSPPTPPIWSPASWSTGAPAVPRHQPGRGSWFEFAQAVLESGG